MAQARCHGKYGQARNPSPKTAQQLSAENRHIYDAGGSTTIRAGAYYTAILADSMDTYAAILVQDDYEAVPGKALVRVMHFSPDGESSPKNCSDVNLKFIAKIGNHEKEQIHGEPDHWHFKGAGKRQISI